MNKRKVLENLAWKLENKNYKIRFEGEKSILVNGEKGITLKFLTEFSDEELELRIYRARNKELSKREALVFVRKEDVEKVAERGFEPIYDPYDTYGVLYMSLIKAVDKHTQEKIWLQAYVYQFKEFEDGADVDWTPEYYRIMPR